MGSPSQDLSKHTEAEESPWIGLPSVRPAPRNTSLVIRMQLTAPWRVPLRSSYHTAPKAKAVQDHFLCSWMLCLPGICFQIHAKPTSLQVSFQVPDIYDTSGQRDIQQIHSKNQLNWASVHQDAPQHMQ